MARALVGIEGLLIASFVAGCGGGGTDPGAPPRAAQVVFTTDRATNAQLASIRIISPNGEVSSDLIATISSKVRVATWPGDVEVATTETILTGMAAVLPNVVYPAGTVVIDRQLDPGLDPSAWYAISLPASTSYTLPVGFAFDDGARGSRFSPTHAPVVASITSCPNQGVVTVYAWYSERVVQAAGAAPTLDYGATPVSCTIRSDGATATEFICPGTAEQPFSLRIPDGVTAEASGAAMAPGSIGSAGMQTVAGNGCTIYMPLTND
jgi:hypothetical protein